MMLQNQSIENSWKYRLRNIFIQKYIVMKQETVKINVGVTREFQKEQGYFDGRFVSRIEKSKKLYTRKRKHKNTNE